MAGSSVSLALVAVNSVPEDDMVVESTDCFLSIFSDAILFTLLLNPPFCELDVCEAVESMNALVESDSDAADATEDLLEMNPVIFFNVDGFLLGALDDDDDGSVPTT